MAAVISCYRWEQVQKVHMIYWAHQSATLIRCKKTIWKYDISFSFTCCFVQMKGSTVNGEKLFKLSQICAITQLGVNVSEEETMKREWKWNSKIWETERKRYFEWINTSILFDCLNRVANCFVSLFCINACAWIKKGRFNYF